MILSLDKEINNGGICYKVTDLLYSDTGGYREEYRAFAYKDQAKKQTDRVRLIVYKKQLGNAYISLQLAGEREAMLSRKLSGSAFDAYLDDFETISDDGGVIMVIVTKMNEAKTLREFIANDDVDKIDLWRIFTDVIVGLNEISHQTDGGCHFGITPDNIYIYHDQEKLLRGLIRGLNLVCEDFEQNEGLDKNLVLPEFRAPETIISQFIPKSMQWSLALLLAYMLQREHPWRLKPDATKYHAYTRMRRNKPQIIDCDGLGVVLKKALSINPAHRYPEIDNFVFEVMKFSKIENPSSYECFGKFPTESNGASSSLSTKTTVGEEDVNKYEDTIMPSIDTSKEPKMSVRLSVEKGEGFAAVAGMSELKEELHRDFIDLIANRRLADKFGIVPPGMLLYGPPGCGKTYLAEHLAQELGIEYSFVNPADLGSIYIHGSQKMIAELFVNAEKKAQKNGKGVLLIFDEVESMIPSRLSENNDNQAGEVAEFLTRLNNSSKRGVYVIGLTNCLDKIDKAALRKGRLDKVIYIDLPDFEARKALFEYELAKRPHVKNINLEYLSKITEGYTSSDITYIVTESARVMFASTLRKNCNAVLKINQSVIEDIIAKTRPSVTSWDIRHYEDMRDQYASREKKCRQSVGFVVST